MSILNQLKEDLTTIFFIGTKCKIRFIYVFPSNTHFYGISRDGSKKFNIRTCEHMILGQLMMGARQMKNAPLLRQRQFCDKTAYVWGLHYQWDSLLSMSPARRLAHFMLPCDVIQIHKINEPRQRCSHCLGLDFSFCRPSWASLFSLFILSFHW